MGVGNNSRGLFQCGFAAILRVRWIGNKSQRWRHDAFSQQLDPDHFRPVNTGDHFTPVKIVDEVLVSRNEIKDLTGLNDMSIAAPQGTAYEETLLELAQKYPYMGIILENTETSAYTMLREVSEGRSPAQKSEVRFCSACI